MVGNKNGFHIFTILIIAAFALTLTAPALAYFVPSNGQTATRVLGQTNFSSSGIGSGQSGLTYPTGVAVDPTTGKVFVADSNNSRVLRFASVKSLVNGAAAEVVLGQPNFTSTSQATAQNRMSQPYGVFVDAAGRLWVADSFNFRVLRFDHASSKGNGANADRVLGQPNFTTANSGTTRNTMNQVWSVFVDTGGRLWVADFQNSRVLRFDNAASKPNGANADGVLGQQNYTTGSVALTRKGMSNPGAVTVDSAGRLWVADYGNNRILRFNNAAAKTNGADADGVLGQLNFTSNFLTTTQSGMANPYGVTVDNSNGRLYVADFANSRILAFNSAASLPNGANASYVLGQTNFNTGTTNTGGISAATLSFPWAVFYDPGTKVLITADEANSRILFYGKPSRYFPSTSSAADDGWVLESSQSSSAGGTMSAAGTLLVGDDAANRQYRSLLYFNTANLPDNAVVRSVTLQIHKSGVTGSNPFSTLGNLLADIKKGKFGTTALEITDFQAPASANAVGHFTAITSKPGWYKLVVPAVDYKYINLTGVTQFRLRFAQGDNNNHVADYVSFFAGEATSANRPLLTVEYTLP